MCGIIGVYVNNNENKEVAKNLINIFLNQEDRGTRGGGLALLRNKEVMRIRTDTPHRLFYFNFATFWNELQKDDCLIFHHRQPTSNLKSGNTRTNHPFTDESESVYLIHNGIIDNYWQVKDDLVKAGHIFESKKDGFITDTEVLVHLLEDKTKIQEMIDKAKGSMAIAFIYKAENCIYLLKDDCQPIEVYWDENKNYYFSSELPDDKDLVKGSYKKLRPYCLYQLTGEGLFKIQQFKAPPKPKYTYVCGGGYDDLRDSYNWDYKKGKPIYNSHNKSMSMIDTYEPKFKINKKYDKIVNGMKLYKNDKLRNMVMESSHLFRWDEILNNNCYVYNQYFLVEEKGVFYIFEILNKKNKGMLKSEYEDEYGFNDWSKLDY